MDQESQPKRDPERQRRRVLGVLWVIALLVAIYLGSEAIIQAYESITTRLERAAWMWPLAAVVALTLLTNRHVRRRWPDPTHRVGFGVIGFAVLFGLAAAVGPPGVLLVLGLAALFGLLTAWVLVVPRRLAPPLPTDMLEELDDRARLELSDARLKLQNDMRTTALQAIAGLAVLAGAILAFQQLTADRQQATATRELTLQGQASERFTRAIDQLGNNRREVQVGGIYALEQIARQAPDNRVAVNEVLVTYLHRRSPRSANPTMQPVKTLRERAPELQAALSVLVHSRRPFGDPELDLSGLDLRGADISGQHTRTSYVGGDLWYADFRGTDLRRATFSGVYLTYADFRGADLRGADLSQLDALLEFDEAGDPDPGVENAYFDGALADGSTRWPDGFDPSAAGVTMK